MQVVQTLCREDLFDVELESLFSNMETQTELPCSASVRISVALLVVAPSPSPAASHISSWLSTLYPDPPRSVEKREFSLKKPAQPRRQGVLPALSQPAARGAGWQQLYSGTR